MHEIRTVFLDRDGVINRLRSDYVRSWDTFEFLPQVKDAIRILNAAGILVVVVTNQRAVARGMLSIGELTRIHDNMRAELAAAGATIDAIYYCPHDKGLCDCRKPGVGMFLQAQRDFPTIDFGKSALVGDSLTDMQAGARLGCHLMLVTDTGCTDCTKGDPGAIEAVGIALDGTARTLHEMVERHIVVTATIRTRQNGSSGAELNQEDDQWSESPRPAEL